MVVMLYFLKRVCVCVFVCVVSMRMCFVMCGRDLLDWIELPLSLSFCLLLSSSHKFSVNLSSSGSLTPPTHTHSFFSGLPCSPFTSSASFSCSACFFFPTPLLAPAHFFFFLHHFFPSCFRLVLSPFFL